MTADEDLLHESAEDLFENAPCGYLSTTPDGTIIRVNRTFEGLTGLRREDLVGRRRFQDLLTAGGRIYHETHYAPLLHMQGAISEVAVEIVKSDGTPLSALINSTAVPGADGEPRILRTTVFEATDRRRYERELLHARREEHEIAVKLQRGLLAGELPVFPGLELAVSYRPGRSGQEVGGDWYDAFDPGGERQSALLVVGDIVGRGIEAASEMGQLRSALRAVAATGLDPAQVLSALDRYSDRHSVGVMSTIVCAEIDFAAARLTHACAGHPPPLLVPPGGPPLFLWGGRSSPIALDARSPREHEEVLLEAGTTLVLYTDGLIERRGLGIDAGLERLRSEVENLGPLPPADLGDQLLLRLHDPEQADDVCLLVAHLGPA